MATPHLREDAHAFLVRFVDALRPLGDPAAVEAEAARLLGVHLGVNRASYAEIDGDWAVVRGRYVDGVPLLPERIELAAFGELLLDDCRAGRLIVINDARTDPRVPLDVRATFDALSIRATVSVMLIKGGRWVAVFGVDSVKPRVWTPEERELICEVAERTWAAAAQARAEAALRESEARHRRLFETLDDGFSVGEVIRDAAGRVIDWRYLFVNAALERLSGLRPEQVLDRRGSEVFPDDYDTWLPILSDVVDGQRSVRLERGSPALGRTWSTRFFPYGGDRYASIYHDITARKQAETALQASAARQAYLLRLADALRPLRDAEAISYEAACVLGEHLAADRVYYSDIDPGRGTIDIARNWTRHGTASIAGRYPFAMFAWIEPAFAAGTAVAEHDARTSALIPDASRPALVEIGVEAFIAAPLVKDGRLVAALSVIQRETRAWTAEEINLVEETAERTWAAVERARAEAALREANDALEQRVLDRTAQLATSNAALEREVRRHRLAEQQIKSLFRRLVTAQEEERRRVARDMHDQLGQQMTALRMHLDALHGRVGSDGDLREAVARAQGLAGELDQCVDFLTWELRPSALDHLGLAASVRGLVRSWGERFGIDAEFECSAPEDMRLAPEVEANIYRLAQEALHNIVKHAEAQHVSVLLSRRAGQVMLVIEDDGRGFQVDAPAADRGLGLISMRERATLVGGELEIDSEPGRGTSIFVKVPMDGG